MTQRRVGAATAIVAAVILIVQTAGSAPLSLTLATLAAGAAVLSIVLFRSTSSPQDLRAHRIARRVIVGVGILVVVAIVALPLGDVADAVLLGVFLAGGLAWASFSLWARRRPPG